MTVTFGDYENRLTRVIASPAQQGEAIYAYDGEGKRVSSTANSTTTNYLYDGLDILLETNVSGDPVASYLRNPYSGGGIGGIISSQGLIPGQGTVPEVYYSYDGLGSVANLSDTSGASIQAYNYDAFGNSLTTANFTNSRQFLTKELDSTGLIFFGARYYDPSIGRFITQDPMGMIDGPNEYLYCLNDPINLVDLLGLCKKIITGWWPKELDLFVPGYRKYGGPIRNGPGDPEDLLDAASMKHDIIYKTGDFEKGDLNLLEDLVRLPIDPKEWGQGVSPIYGRLYEDAMFAIFSTRVGIIQTKRDFFKILDDSILKEGDF